MENSFYACTAYFASDFGIFASENETYSAGIFLLHVAVSKVKVDPHQIRENGRQLVQCQLSGNI